MNKVARAGLVFGFVAAALGAQEILVLADGTRADGKVHSGARARLTTTFGERVLSVKEIAAREPAAADQVTLKERLAALPKDFLPGRAALGRWCVERGLLTEARGLLEEVLTADIDQPIARAVLQEVARTWLADPAEKGDRQKDRNALVETLFERLAPKSRVDAVIALEKARALPESQTLYPALKNLKAQAPWARWMAAALLAAHRSEPVRIKPLYKRALLDDALAVRREAVRSLRVTDEPAFVRLFARNMLTNTNAAVRVHAAEALGELGMKDAVPHLVEALADTWRPVRNHIAVTTQRAYVKDYDVEVATSAVIADPIVDVVQEGAVLDVGVIGVSIERTVILESLRRLTGRNLGSDPAAWARVAKGG